MLAAFFKSKTTQVFIVLLALFELYNHAIIPAYISAQKGIVTQAEAANAVIRQKAEAQIAEWKSLTETELARNAEKRQRAEAEKAQAESWIRQQQAIIESERAALAARREEAETQKIEYEAAGKKLENMLADQIINDPAGFATRAREDAVRRSEHRN
jgi:hypothetical protein